MHMKYALTIKMRISKCFMMMAILEEEEELKRMELLPSEIHAELRII